MNNVRDLVERALAFVLLMTALSGIAFGVASMAGTGGALGIGLGIGLTSGASNDQPRGPAISQISRPSTGRTRISTIQTTLAPVDGTALEHIDDRPDVGDQDDKADQATDFDAQGASPAKRSVINQNVGAAK